MSQSITVSNNSFTTVGDTAMSASTGAVPVPAGGAEVLVASINSAGVGPLHIVGTVGGTGPLTDLRIACSAYSGPETTTDASVGRDATVLLGSAGDFGVICNFLNRASTSPHTTATGNSFYLAFALDGIVAKLNIYAKSTAGCNLTIDASGAPLRTR